MKGVFVLRWADDVGLKTMKDAGTPFYTVDHLQRVIDEAYEAGRKRGDSEGRVALRRLAEQEGVKMTKPDGSAW
jgi:hypothetical protein